MDIQPWQTRPIFITSTFRDMQAERDHLHSFVFPELAQRLRERYCHLEPIDLRWGVETVDSGDEQAKEMLVLKVCLDEVKRCRPFLIALLGDRYGWIPPKARMHMAAQEAGFEQDVSHKSVTELEIEFGVLSSTEQKRRSFFYFREPLPYAEMDPAVAADYSERYRNEPENNGRALRFGRRIARVFGAGSGRNPTDGQNPVKGRNNPAVKRLEALKARIQRQMPEHVRSYTARWDRQNNAVTGLEAFGDLVLKDLWSVLSQDIAEAAAQATLSWQSVERQLLEQFIEGSSRGFVGRTELLTRLLDHARSATVEVGEAPPWGLSLTGEAGSGKSALFAKLQRELQKVAAKEDKLLLLSHAAGVSPASVQVDAMLRRWVEELGSALDIRQPLAEDAEPEKLEQTFHQLLRQASVKQRVVICIDALNQFERTTRATHLTWLPATWPANARLITTAIPGTASAALAARQGVVEQTLPPLSQREASEIVGSICERYHRSLNPGVLQVLLAKTRPDDSTLPASGNALWLELAIEQLNLLDADDFKRADTAFQGEADARLIQLMREVVKAMPADVPGLYAWLLKRAEKLHGTAFAESFASLLACSRNGWRDADLRPMMLVAMGVPREQWDEQWDALNFAALKRTYRAHLVQKGSQGQRDFAHTQMREAVSRYYLSDEEKVQSLHSLIADHLEQLPAEDPVHESETMFHYIGADDQLRAARYYGNKTLTEGEIKGATEILAHHVLGESSITKNNNLNWITKLVKMETPTETQQAILCHHFIFSLSEVLDNHLSLSEKQCIIQTACIKLTTLSKNNPAQSMWKRVLFVGNGKIASIHQHKGNLKGALASQKDSLLIAESLAGNSPNDSTLKADISIILGKIGSIHDELGNSSKALDAYQRSLSVMEELAKKYPKEDNWKVGLSLSLDRIGMIQKEQGNLADSINSHQRSVSIIQILLEKDPSIIEWQSHLSLYINRVGEIEKYQGDLDSALKSYKRSFAIRETIASHDPENTEFQRDLSVSIEHIGDIQMAQRDFTGAQESYLRGLSIAEFLAAQDPEDAVKQRDLAVSLGNAGDIYLARKNLVDSLGFYKRSVTILEPLANKIRNSQKVQWSLAASIFRVGLIQKSLGDLTSALASLQKCQKIFEFLTKQDQNNLDIQINYLTAINNTGEIQQAQGELSVALISYRRGLTIAETLAARDLDNADWQRNLAVSLDRIGDIQKARGDLENALTSHQRALAIREALVRKEPGNGDWEHELSVSLERFGDIQETQGDLTDALATQQKVLAIRETLTPQYPLNIRWLQDLAVSNYNVADLLNQLDDNARSEVHREQCYRLLSAMSDDGVNLYPQLAELLEKLKEERI